MLEVVEDLTLAGEKRLSAYEFLDGHEGAAESVLWAGASAVVWSAAAQLFPTNWLQYVIYY